MLKSEIQNLQQEISKSYMKGDDGLSADLIKIMSNNRQIRIGPFHGIFLGETRMFECFLENNPLSSNDNSILLSFTSKICCCIQ